MPALTPAAARQQILQGRLAPVYLVVGADEAEKTSLAGAFAEVVEEGLRAFNVERLQGGEARGVDVVDAARTLPMMAPRRVVIVAHAERMLVPKRESAEVTRGLEALEAYVKRPEGHATVVLVASGLDMRTRMAKLLQRDAVVVECEGTGDPARFIRQAAADAGQKIEPAAVALLARRAGTDIQRLRSDVARVLLYALGQEVVSVGDVQDVIGPATSEDAWAVTNAIMDGDAARALRELSLVFEGGGVAQQVLGQLGWLARTKMRGAQVPDAVEAVFRTELDLKTSAGDPRVLLERLVIELCRRGGRGARILRP